MKPILFNTDMVRAILAGRKTCTRRAVKPHFRPGEIGWQVITEKHSGKYVRIEYLDEWENETRYMKEPFYPGDILYVRETFRIDYLSNIHGAGRIQYKADGTYSDFTFDPTRYDMMRRAQKKPWWRPNENMPREAARIFLRVTDVRVERLQEIGAAGIRAEGLDTMAAFVGDMEIARAEFRNLWNSTIKPADLGTYGWDANPWVWVISFERCEKPEEADHDR